MTEGWDLGMSELLKGRWQDTQSSALKTGASESLCDLRQLLPCPAKPHFSGLQQHRLGRPLLPRPLFLRGTLDSHISTQPYPPLAEKSQQPALNHMPASQAGENQFPRAPSPPG